MKRLLSLLVALALVLSMVPNVFATSEFDDNDPNGSVDFDELLGKYDRVAEIDQITVSLEEGSEGQKYVWTPSEDGTLSINLFADDIPEGAEIDYVVTQGDNFAIYSESEDSSVTIEVVGGKDVSIEVFEANAAAVEFTLYGTFTAVPGTENNPLALWDQENTVTNVGTTWYQCYFGGTTMTVSGEGEFSVIYNGETIAAVDGIVSVDVEAAGPRMPVKFAIVGDGEYAVNFAYPVGTQMNPEVIFRPAYIPVNIAEGNNQGYYYSWTSNADGELKLTCPAVEGVEYDVNMTNMTTYAQAWLQDSTDGTITLAVSAGDEVIIQVATYPDDNYNYPALETALTGEFIYPVGTQMNPEIIFRPAYIPVNIAEGNNQGYYYKWTSNADGELKLTCPAVEGVEYDVVMTNMTTYVQAWLQDSTDGTITLAASAGDEIVIQVVAYPDENYNYPALETALTGEFIFPAGTQGNPAALVIGENTAAIEAGNNQGYFYSWIAEEDGTLTITMPEGNWMYTINNLTAGVYGDTQWSDSDPVMQTATIEVSAGDEIQVIVCTYDPADMWNTPAGEITFTAELVTGSALAITTQPADQTVSDGSEVTFSVVAEGTDLTYEWSYRESAENDWVVCGDAASLTVTAEVAMNGYQYKCVVSDAKGNSIESDVATLTVNAKSEITDSPESVGIIAGNTATFTVEATGVASYKWYYRRNESARWVSTKATGYNTNTLSVKALLGRDGYQYRCMITGLDGSVMYSEPATMTVSPSITITQHPSRQSVSTDETGVFVIAAESVQGIGLTYQWQYCTKDNPNWMNTSLPGYDTNTLNVAGLIGRNGYQYRCAIIDENNIKVYTRSATLVVIGFSKQPKDATAAIGTNATFSATGIGVGLKYQWQYRTNAEGSWKNTTMTGATTETLTVGVTAARNGYQYRCKITDENNAIAYSQPATLTASQPIVISAQPASVTAAANEIVYFTVEATGDIASYKWELRKTVDGSWSATTMTGYNTNSLEVKALSGRNGYAYRCVITDVAGNVTITEPAVLTVG